MTTIVARPACSVGETPGELDRGGDRSGRQLAVVGAGLHFHPAPCRRNCRLIGNDKVECAVADLGLDAGGVAEQLDGGVVDLKLRAELVESDGAEILELE